MPSFKASSFRNTVENVSFAPNTVSNIFSSSSVYHQNGGTEILQSSQGNDVSVAQFSNGFVGAVFDSYNRHHRLVLRPDDVWISILTQFSLYVDKNAEELRHYFVTHQGQKQLVVSGNGSLRCANYPRLTELMTDEIKKNLTDGSVREWMIPSFTTTTFDDKITASVIMMSAMQKYFSYKMCLCCGIPEIELLGQLSDWLNLRERVQKLETYETSQGHMKDWVKLLLPIIDEFICSYQGKVNLGFWDTICDYRGGGSGPSYLSGWITAFCVFSETGNWQGSQTRVQNWNETIDNKGYPIIDTNDIPAGIVSVPVTVDDNGTEYKTRMFAGQIACDVLNKNTLQPRSDWMIALVDETKVQKNRFDY